MIEAEGLPAELEELAQKAREFDTPWKFEQSFRETSGDTLVLIDDLKLPLTTNERFSLRTPALYKMSYPEAYVVKLFKAGFAHRYKFGLITLWEKANVPVEAR